MEVVKEVIFGLVKIGLITMLAYGQCNSSSRIDALEARVKDLAAHLEVKASEGRDDRAVLREVALVLAGRVRADEERHDAQGARAVVLDGEDGRAAAAQPADGEAHARREPLADAVDDLDADPECGDGGEDERKGFVHVHGGQYSKKPRD